MSPPPPGRLRRTRRQRPKVISDWNLIAVNTMVGDTTKTGHPQVFLYLGFVQAAVCDAVAGIGRGYAPCAFHDRAPIS